jgi:hypothetical protein
VVAFFTSCIFKADRFSLGIARRPCGSGRPVTAPARRFDPAFVILIFLPHRLMWALGDWPSGAHDALSPVLARTVRRQRVDRTDLVLLIRFGSLIGCGLVGQFPDLSDLALRALVRAGLALDGREPRRGQAGSIAGLSRLRRGTLVKSSCDLAVRGPAGLRQT